VFSRDLKLKSPSEDLSSRAISSLITRSLCPALLFDEIGNERDGDIFAAVGFDGIQDDNYQPDEWPNAANDGDEG
jgi:hypothetical protein